MLTEGKPPVNNNYFTMGPVANRSAPPPNNYNTMGPVANRSENPPLPGEPVANGAPGALNDPYNYANALQQYLQYQANQGRNDFIAGLNQIGTRWGEGEANRRYAGNEYQNQIDMLNWQRGGLGREQESASANLAFRDQIIANLQSVYGINDRALANQIAQSMLDQSVQSNILGTNLRQNALETLQKSQSLRSSGIAGGSMFFPGQGIGQGQISDAGAMAADILNQRLRGVTEGGDLTRQGFNIAAEKERVGLDNSILGQRQTRLSDADAVFNLGRMGEKYNIQERGYQNQRNQTYEQIAAQQNAALNQINQLRQSGDANQQALAEQLAQLLGIA